MKKEDSDGERSDADLVVDDDESKAGNGNGIHGGSNGSGATTNNNGNRSPRENGSSNATNDAGSKKDPLSPSSARSTPASSSGKKDEAGKTSSSSPGASKILPPKSALGALAGTKSCCNPLWKVVKKSSFFSFGSLAIFYRISFRP